MSIYSSAFAASPSRDLTISTHANRRSRVSLPVFVGAVRAFDVVGFAFAGALTWYVGAYFADVMPTGGGALAALLAGWASVMCLNRTRAYNFGELTSFRAQARRFPPAMAAGLLVLLVSMAVVRDGQAPGLAWPAVWAAVTITLFLPGRFALTRAARTMVRDGRLGRRIALFGSTEATAAFAHSLGGQGAMAGVELSGLYDEVAARPDTGAGATSAFLPPFRGGVSALVADIQGGAVDAVVVGYAPDETERLDAIRRQLGGVVTDIFVAFDAGVSTDIQVGRLGGVPVGILGRRPLSDWQRLQKDVFDRLAAAMLMLVFGPAMALIALAIRLDSPGPILFRQPRIGLNNQAFSCLKFRSMYHHMTDALADRQTTRDDKRITRVGQWIRRLSLDELPQLLNVLRGDMSLVGPRPHAPNTKAAGYLFTDAVPDYATRHRVKPGITGWAQVNGWRGETRTIEQLEQRILHDRHYIENWSFTFDIRILVLTAFRGFVSPQAF